MDENAMRNPPEDEWDKRMVDLNERWLNLILRSKENNGVYYAGELAWIAIMAVHTKYSLEKYNKKYDGWFSDQWNDDNERIDWIKEDYNLTNKESDSFLNTPEEIYNNINSIYGKRDLLLRIRFFQGEVKYEGVDEKQMDKHPIYLMYAGFSTNVNSKSKNDKSYHWKLCFSTDRFSHYWTYETNTHKWCNPKITLEYIEECHKALDKLAYLHSLL